MKLPSLLCSLACTAAVSAQTITFAEGSPTSLTIVAVAEAAPNGGDTVLLQDVELLDLELTGRTLLQANDATRTRRLVLQGIARAELPGGGRVLRYRRAGGAFWGFLHIAADGAPRVALELPGSGTNGLGDPFVDRIAIGRDGTHAAIALLAGGVFVVRLDGGVFASTGRPDRLAGPVGHVVEPKSVLVGATHVFWQTGVPSLLYRCALTDGAVPQDVTPPPPQPVSELEDGMAMSGDGTKLVFLYGPHHDENLFWIDSTGPAQMLPPPSSKYENPGYLPEEPGEPALLLNHDGSRLFFVDSDVRDELYLLDTTGALPTLAMTEDAVFEPYIGVHILPRFAGGRLTIAIGDPAQMDWFGVELAPGGGTVENLTVTGAGTMPFPSGTIAPVQAVDTGNFLLVSEQQGADLVLRRIDPVTGAQTVLQQNVLTAPNVGASAMAGVDVLARTSAGDALLDGTTGIVLGVLPPGLLLTPPVRGPVFSASWLHLDAGFGVGAYWLPDGTLALSGIDFGLQQIALTAGGGAVEIGSSVRYLAPGASTVLNRPAAAVRLCLSGSGS